VELDADARNSPPKVRDYSDISERLHELSSSPNVRLLTLGHYRADNEDYSIYAVHLGNPDPNKLSVLISAGIHGDEPASVEAALQFIAHNAGDASLLKHYHFVIFPCDNPWGWEHNSRENADGIDLNRQFRVRHPVPEIALMADLLHSRCFDLVYDMHEDYDSPGFYLYELSEDPSAIVGEAIVHEVSIAGYPINRSHIIEGRRAKNGIIRPNGSNFRKTRVPKALYSFAECGGHVLTLETPSTYLSIADRVRIHLIGLKVSLDRTRLHKDAMSGI
jgi:hypothetical protein